MGWRLKRRTLAGTALLGLLLLCVSTLVTIHTHGALGPQFDPLGGSHHCLLCVAAHLPLAVGAEAPAAVPAFNPPAILVACEYESAAEPLYIFSLYMRPPPAAL